MSVASVPMVGPEEGAPVKSRDPEDIAAVKRLEMCRADHADALSKARLTILSRRHNTWEEVETVINGTFDGLVHNVLDAATRLADTDAESARKRLKETASWYEAKLDTVRKASDVKLTNQAVMMEAAFTRKFDEKVKSLVSGGDSLTKELYAKVDQLTTMKQTIKQGLNSK